MSISLPEITEAQRLELRPGDALAVRIGQHEVSRADAEYIKAAVRAELGRPDLPVLVLGRGMGVEIVGTGSASGP